MPGTIDLIAGMNAIRQAYPDYERAEEYFLGTRPEYFADARFRLALERTGTTFRLNFSKTPVNAVADRLEISGIVGVGAQAETITKALQQVGVENKMDLEMPEVHLRGCEFGDAYVLVWPTEQIDDIEYETEDVAQYIENDNGTPIISGGGVTIYYNDPRSVRAIYDPENQQRMLFVVKMWQPNVNEKQLRINLYYRDRIEKWVTVGNRSGERLMDWEPFQDGDNAWPMDNPYGQIPFFHFRTDRPYGVPVHRDAYGPQDIITKLVITHMAVIDYHGYPQRWALVNPDLAAGDADAEDFGIGDDDIEPDQETNAAPNGAAQMRGAPGHMWFLKNIKSVGQFQAADSKTFTDPLTLYVRSMAQLTQTPLHYFDAVGDSPSGESLRVAEAPLVKKCDAIKRLFGSTWQDLYDFVLLIQGMPDSAGKVKITWKSSAAADDQLGWMLATMKKELGVPIWQILMEAGYTEAQLTQWDVPPAKYVDPLAAVPSTVIGPDGKPVPGVGGQPLPPPAPPTLPLIHENLVGGTGRIG